MALSRRQWLAFSGGCVVSGMGAPLLAQTAPGPAPRRIVWGQSAPLTGAASEIGLAFAGGAKLYVDAFNDANPAQRIELRQIDDGFEPARAGANAMKLLADGADLLFGFVGTGSSNAGAQVAQE